MHKYRVLKSYPKQITNSGRLITLKLGAKLYLKPERQVLRLISMGYLKPVVELPKKKKKKAKKIMKVEVQDSQAKKNKKSEYLNKKKNKGKMDSKES